MNSKESKKYFVVCMRETDGWPGVLLLSGQSVKELADKIGQDAISIFEGNLIKSFDSKIDLTKL